jgi:hypothetical protein
MPHPSSNKLYIVRHTHFTDQLVSPVLKNNWKKKIEL